MEQSPSRLFSPEVSRLKVAEALGIREEDIDPRFPIEVAYTGLPSLKAPIMSLEVMERMRPVDARVLEVCSKSNAGDIFVFCLDTKDSEASVHTRCFAAPYGVHEDPATGTANGSLGAYLAAHNIFEADKEGVVQYVSEQGLEMGRGAKIFVCVSPMGAEKEGFRVSVGGQAVESAKGVLLLP